MLKMLNNSHQQVLKTNYKMVIRISETLILKKFNCHNKMMNSTHKIIIRRMIMIIIQVYY